MSPAASTQIFSFPPPATFSRWLTPATNVISSFGPVYPPQFADVSFGRDRISPDVVGTSPPQSGRANSTVGAGFSRR